MSAMRRRTVALITLCVLTGCAVAFALPSQGPSSGVAHYEYVASTGTLFVYDIDKLPSLVERFPLPSVDEIRGIGASAATGMLYISYGGFPHGTGHLLEFSLYRRKIIYSRHYPFGIDSFDITHNGQLIFMPIGENTSGYTWHVLAANTGAVVGAITAGKAPHDTVVSVNGKYVFLGGASSPYLYEADVTRPWKIVARIGPLVPAGVRGIRPYTVNAQNTLVFTTGDRYLGFQVSDIATGRVLYTVPVPGYKMPPTYKGLEAAHGIGLSPDQRFLWLLDEPNQAVHEFDISGLPRKAPVLVATMHVGGGPKSINGGDPDWLNLSRDGRYLFVGDSGTVIDTTTRSTVATIGALIGSRYNIEVDWSGRRVCAAYPRASLGYLHVAPPCSDQTG
jgi:DNA-binding beta-propeller fold protein YncE